MTSLVLVLAFALLGGPAAQDEAPVFDISFCRASVPDLLKTGKANFVAVYSLEAMEDGAVAFDRELRNMEGVLPPVECFRTWRITGLAEGAEIKVVQTWEHGKGWIRQSVVTSVATIRLQSTVAVDYP